MIRTLVLFLVVACGKGGDKASPPPPAPVPDVAKTVVPDEPVADVVVPLPWRTEELAPGIAEQAGQALVERSAGKCKAASPQPIYTAVVEHEGAHLIGIDCGERGSHVIGLVRHDGKTATVIAAAHVATGSVRVDRILASETELCMQYNQVDAIRITKNLRVCFPKTGTKDLPTVAPPPNPTTALPTWAAPEAAITVAKAQVYQEIQTCQDAKDRPPETTYAVAHGKREWIAVSCGDLAKPANGLALFEFRDGKPTLLAYSLDADTKTMAMDRIRASEQLACMDYKQLPSGDRAELCLALY